MSDLDCVELEENLSKKATKRGPNFTTKEKETLLEIIQNVEGYEVLKSRDNTSKVKEKKERTWMIVHSQFVTAGVSPKLRDVDSLKVCFKNLTTRTKDAYSEFKKQTKKTGGGPAPKPLGCIEETMVGILGDDLKCLDNRYDCDSEWVDKKDTFDANQKSPADDNPVEEDEIKFLAEATQKSSRARSQSQAYDRILLQQKLVDQKMQQEAEAHNLRINLIKMEHEVMKKKLETAELERESAIMKKKKFELDFYSFDNSDQFSSSLKDGKNDKSPA